MRLGPIDFSQPSTWKGAIGILSVFGIAISPELAAQIALVAAGAVSLIEMIRNEYFSPLPPIELQSPAYRVTDGVGVVARDRVSDDRVSTTSVQTNGRVPEDQRTDNASIASFNDQ